VKPYLLHAYRKKKKQNRADDEASAYGKARRIIASLFLWRGAYIPAYRTKRVDENRSTAR